MKHIVCFHLYNDYSGSPKVLRMVLEGLLRRGCRIDLVTSRVGVLNELRGFEGITFHQYDYRPLRPAALGIFNYCWRQVWAFFKALSLGRDKEAVFYINTILPAGAALAARLMGRRVVYHYHENAFIKSAFYRMLARIMQRVAHRIICVSGYQASFLKRKEGVTVVPNALQQSFIDRLHPDVGAAFERKNVLMLASLKEYKGVREFVELAHRLPQYKFTLVINDTQENVDEYMAKITPPPFR